MRGGIRFNIAMALTLTAVLAASPAWGGALGRIQAIGTRDISAGADPDGFQIQSNCAARTQLEHTWAEATFEMVKPQFTYTSRCGAETHSSMTVYPMPYLNYGEPLGDWGAFGVDLKVPFGLGTDFENNPQQLGYDTATLIALTRLSPTLALRLSDQWSVGFALNAGMAQFQYKAPLALGGMCMPVYTDNEAHGFGVGGGLGVMWKPGGDWTLGANWTSALKAHLEGDSKIMRGALQIRDDFDTSFVFPSRFDFGVTKQVNRHLVLGADYHFWNYSKTPNDIVLQFENLHISKSQLLAWKDGWGGRVGAAWKVNSSWTLRAGLGYLSQSIPDKTMSTLTPDSPGFGMGAGVSRRFTDFLTVDASITRGGGSNRVDHGIWGRAKYSAEVTTVALSGNFDF
jgi:long-chain fatty acid transport protein